MSEIGQLSQIKEKRAKPQEKTYRLPFFCFILFYALLAEPKSSIFSLTVALIASTPGEQGKSVNNVFSAAKSTKQGVGRTEELDLFLNGSLDCLNAG